MNVKTAEPIVPKICVGRDPGEGLWMIKISDICLYQKSILKILKIHEICC